MYTAVFFVLTHDETNHDVQILEHRFTFHALINKCTLNFENRGMIYSYFDFGLKPAISVALPTP